MTVGDFRKLFENFEDDWKIELSLIKESNSKISLYDYYPLEIENEIIDVCYSEHEISILCKEVER